MKVRGISPALLAHKSSSNSTLAFLLLIGPLSDGSYIGLTSCGRDLEYNPHDYDSNLPNVTQRFYASTGAEVSNLQATNDLAVNNGETKSLVLQYPGQGISEAMVDNGDLDGKEYWIFLINHRDKTMGHEVMGNGPIGEVRMHTGGLVSFECRSWTDLLRQNSVCERDSRRCRATFGSQAGEERFPCYYDLTAEWITGIAVTAVGAETVRDFTAAALVQADGYFEPGLVTWRGGANAGMSREVETFDSGGVIALEFTTRHPIQVGDTFDIRRDCTKNWGRAMPTDPIEVNSCLFFGNEQWFRGEPKIRIADVINLTVPGAANGGL